MNRQFKVRHIEGDRFRIAFFTRETASGKPVVTDSPEVDAAFEALRVELKELSYVPTMQIVTGEGVVTVSRLVDPPFRRSRVNWIFFIATMVAVQSAGAIWWAGYISPPGPTGTEPPVDWLSLQAQGGGALYFALPLLSILSLHEMGHFFMARHHHVRASLPFFLPFLWPLGTLGAFISMRDPLPSRRAIFDIGLSGPVIGFLSSIVVTVVGALLMQANPSPARPEFGNGLNIGDPLMYDWILGVIGTPANSYLHPMLVAGWAGFYVTAFNLIPAGQLDGGHVMYSLLRNGPARASRGVATSALAVIGIAVFGVLLGYWGWTLLIIIVFLTIRHPPPLNQVSSLGTKRVVAGALGLLVLAVSFSPAPLTLIPGDYAFDGSAASGVVMVAAGGNANVSLTFENLGNTYNNLEVQVNGTAGPFSASFGETNASAIVLTNLLEFKEQSVNLTVWAVTLLEGQDGAVFLRVKAVGDATQQKALVVVAHSVRAHPALALGAPENTSAPPGAIASVPVEACNEGDVPLNLTMGVQTFFSSWSSGFGELNNGNTSLRVSPDQCAIVNYVVQVPERAVSGDAATFTVEAHDGNWTAIDASVSFAVHAGA